MTETQKLSTEIDELANAAERLSRTAASSGNLLGPDRIEELSSLLRVPAR